MTQVIKSIRAQADPENPGKWIYTYYIYDTVTQEYSWYVAEAVAVTPEMSSPDDPTIGDILVAAGYTDIDMPVTT